MHARRVVSLLSCLTVAFLAPCARAAEDKGRTEPAVLRDRVRLQCAADAEGPCRGRLIGRLLAADADRLTLAVTDRSEPLVLERRDIARLEVSRGRQTARGAGKGALTGGIVLGLVGLGIAALWDGSNNPDSPIDAGDYLVLTGMSAGLGALAGTVTGALVGTASEQWKPAHAPPVRLSVAPRPKGAALSLSIRF